MTDTQPNPDYFTGFVEMRQGDSAALIRQLAEGELSTERAKSDTFTRSTRPQLGDIAAGAYLAGLSRTEAIEAARQVVDGINADTANQTLDPKTVEGIKADIDGGLELSLGIEIGLAELIRRVDAAHQASGLPPSGEAQAIDTESMNG